MIDLPTKTKAAILVAQQQPLVVDTIELPSSLEIGQVLVEVHCSGICGSQLGEIDGVKGRDRFLPHLLGHEGFGTVQLVRVRNVITGDNVVLHWRPGAGWKRSTNTSGAVKNNAGGHYVQSTRNKPMYQSSKRN